MPNFAGQLRPNEIFSALFNMIISQEVYADNINGTYSELVDMARTDGGLFGDTKLFYSTDALKSVAWGADAEATNLLQLHRPKAPECQSIVLDVFRQIPLTVDYYLTKRAWSTENAFASFTSVMLGWMSETKKIYDATTYNAYIGTTETQVGKQLQEVKVADAVGNATGEEANRLEAQAIAEHVANLLVDMKDISRDFNDYRHLRSYNENEIKIIWNSKYVNKINKLDLPTIFHKDGVVDKLADHVLPARYFGNKLDSVLATASVYNESSNPKGMFTKSGNNYTIVNSGQTAYKVRSLIETDYTVSGVVTHVFPGDTIPVGAVLEITSSTVPFAYIENEDIIAKVVTRMVPYFSAFEVATSFFNAKSLTENQYLTFGHNTLEYLKGKPFITLYKD